MVQCVYGSHLCIIIYTSYKLLKNRPVFMAHVYDLLARAGSRSCTIARSGAPSGIQKQSLWCGVTFAYLTANFAHECSECEKSQSACYTYSRRLGCILSFSPVSVLATCNRSVTTTKVLYSRTVMNSSMANLSVKL